ncbi:cytochrome c-type biogenesis protein [Ectothiorhodospira mobilis]|jgi:cytochrome c-type biogenesis protein CcmH|uniref:cytochrome c-type biogenesis protein n=1 Tax=Ectothiorhodospira mobilis TaxID=195064 RepID=UPI001EE9740B|nr:cytochrome c-type biogenesis protein [Ectothiorhodospira mobilis]MCG5534830.1 cytochrome c-type biogenesis protein CcmH [Ectothiorhodospira mobilis]
MMKKTAWLLLLLLAAPIPAPAQGVDPTPFDDPKMEDRYRALLHQLRCTVCQNQSLADSNAGLARDLRREVREQLRAGVSDEGITEYLVARYGDFVLYRPPLSARTLLLWTGPFLLLALGLGAVHLAARQSRRAGARPAVDPAARERARRLLEGEDEA